MDSISSGYHSLFEDLSHGIWQLSVRQDQISLAPDFFPDASALPLDHLVG